MDVLEQVAERIKSARGIFVFIGSGLSAASGVPLYRDEEGKYIHPEVLPYTQRKTFDEDPARMLAWYNQKRASLDRVWPNGAHYALAKLAAFKPCVFATQNVDGLLEQALEHEDVDAEVLRLHGSLRISRCDACKTRDYSNAEWGLENRCQRCGELLRPDVVWFGEPLPRGLVDAATEALLESSVCLIVGSSGLVFPAAELPSYASERGLYVVEVNTHESHFSADADVFLKGPAEEVLPALNQAIGLL